MATKKFLELKEFSTEDLVNELSEAKAQFKKMKFDHNVQGIESPIELRKVRRDVARLHTEVRRREIEAMGPEQLDNRSNIRRRRRTR